MQRFWITVKLFLCILVQSNSLRVKVNHARISVSEGDSFQILCTADQEIKACYIKTPQNETRIIYLGASYEQSRMVQHENEAFQCGVEVYNATTEVDNGRWECGISLISEKKSRLVRKFIDVTILTPPSNVELKVGGVVVKHSLISLDMLEAEILYFLSKF